MNLNRTGTALAAVLLATVVAASCSKDKKEEAHRWVQQDHALLLDVRTTEEFAQGHVDGAVNIPVQNLQTRLEEVGAKDKPVVVYCASGVRSARARRMLMEAGYQKVLDLGGMDNW